MAPPEPLFLPPIQQAGGAMRTAAAPMGPYGMSPPMMTMQQQQQSLGAYPDRRAFGAVPRSEFGDHHRFAAAGSASGPMHLLQHGQPMHPQHQMHLQQQQQQQMQQQRMFPPIQQQDYGFSGRAGGGGGGGHSRQPTLRPMDYADELGEVGISGGGGGGGGGTYRAAMGGAGGIGYAGGVDMFGATHFATSPGMGAPGGGGGVALAPLHSRHASMPMHMPLRSTPAVHAAAAAAAAAAQQHQFAPASPSHPHDAFPPTIVSRASIASRESEALRRHQRRLSTPTERRPSMSTSERYRVNQPLSVAALGLEFEPYTYRDYRVLKSRDSHMRLPQGLGRNEDDEWRAQFEKRARMAEYAEQVRAHEAIARQESRLHEPRSRSNSVRTRRAVEPVVYPGDPVYADAAAAGCVGGK
ncbi:hypothetical protein HK105_200941 [Polyrhizophydium stewartii]|uniref:Uncharacterized protein n=1 Tax=Polyrhizophydium stewartii TaxID=2732419 RepID=A0ABR4NIF0_9FUNG